MAAFRFGGHGHQQGAGAAGNVGDVERRGKLVVAPVNALRPVVEHQPREQRRRRDGGVIGAGEFGVGEQRVEEPARQVVSRQVAGVFHRLEDWLHHRAVPEVRQVGIVQDGQHSFGQVKHRHVIDGFADVVPNLQQPGHTAIPPRFGDGGYGVVGGREAQMEGQGVEYDQAADAQGLGAVSFPVGLGDGLPDQAGQPGIGGQFGRRLFNGVLDDGGGGDHAVGAFQFQRQHAQVVGDLGGRAEPGA